VKPAIRWILSLPLLACGLGTAAAEPEFVCVITANRTSYEVGDVPDLAIRVINHSAEDVVLVGSLDGSPEGMRYPHCVLEIVDQSGKPVGGPYGRCGNMNPLSASDFMVVPTGMAFDPFGEKFFRPPALVFPINEPGDYTFRFHYATSGRIQDFFGDERGDSLYAGTPEIQQLFERVPKVDLVSQELKLTFAPKPE
jgi:hypothetical protein